MSTQENTAQVLNREWFVELEKQAATNFINLPIEFQLRKYDYNSIANSYLTFFSSDDNTRADKLILARKFLNFIRNINKNRARNELGEQFFMCFEYFMENFGDLLSKQDKIHLDTLDIISSAIDKTQFIEDIISVDELKKRIVNLKSIQEKEVEIKELFDNEIIIEYEELNSNREERDKYVLSSSLNSGELEDIKQIENTGENNNESAVDIGNTG